MCEPELSVVLFLRDRCGWKIYDRWSARLLADQIAFVLPTSWDGEPVARLLSGSTVNVAFIRYFPAECGIHQAGAVMGV